ncbi:MAG: GatB/YqeY domain-containing protein [Deltaproteobacteria bacterium]|nr:GatB/YqeY domain-containing protein [Deltaproteobacteria bacterium]
MDIIVKVENEMKDAAKARDKVRLSALRMMKAALHNREIDSKDGLTEQDEIQVLSSLAKQRKDSIEQFKNGGRLELAEREEQELNIIQEFMPEQISEEEIAAIIEKAIEEVGAASVRDMGKVMKALMPEITGRADGKVVSELVKERLSS